MNDKKRLNKMPFYKQLLLIIGVFCIVWGLFFVYLSISKERIDKNSKIAEVTEYVADKPKLTIGEIKVTKSTRYLKDAQYKLEYKNYMNSENNTEVLDKTSGIQIVDVLGNGYSLVENSLKVNDKKYTKNEQIKVDIENHTIKIDIPNELCSTINKVEAVIKLTDKSPDIKFFTSQDAYYNFVPSENNKFYEKKTPQSYLIDGNGYIKLTEDKK